MSLATPNLQVQRVDNIIYGPRLPLKIDNRGLGKYLFEKFVEHGEKTFQINAATGEEETYEFVNKKCIRVALEMRKRGIQENDVVFICSSNNMESIVLNVAILYLNAITVTLDPTISLRDSTHLLKLIRPKLVLVEETSLDLIESALKDTIFETQLVVIGHTTQHVTYADFLLPKEGEDDFVPEDVGNIKNTGVIFFSSGTTGLPKGIEISHYSVIYMVESILIGTGNYTCATHFTSFYWMTAVVITFLVIRCGGRKLVIKNFEPETALLYIQKYKIGNVFLPPSYTYQITEDLVSKYPCVDLKNIILGGSGISKEQLTKLRNYFPKSMISLAYAQTEAGGVISSFTPLSYQKFKGKLGSSGQPILNIELRIVDTETEEVLGSNQNGEIRVKTPGACNGYYNQDSSDILDTEGYIKTGDIGYYDEDLCLYVCDRIKDMFKYRSWHIVPMSIENVIYEHPAVHEVLVIGIPQEVDGHIPMALIVLQDNVDGIEEDELLQFANARLLEREQLRAGLKIVKKLPKGTTGKISRKYITDLVVSGQIQKLME